MKFNCYPSGDDTGKTIILYSVMLQPETVLGLHIVSYPGSPNEKDPSDSCYDTLKEFSDEWADSLHKYQAVVLLTHPVGNVFDVTATLFHPRYPQEYLMQLAEHIPDVPVGFTKRMPEGVSTVSDFHTCPRALKKSWVIGHDHPTETQPSLQRALENLIIAGLQAKVKAAITTSSTAS